jgi:hypothetical protein
LSATASSLDRPGRSVIGCAAIKSLHFSIQPIPSTTISN